MGPRRRLRERGPTDAYSTSVRRSVDLLPPRGERGPDPDRSRSAFALRRRARGSHHADRVQTAPDTCSQSGQSHDRGPDPECPLGGGLRTDEIPAHPSASATTEDRAGPRASRPSSEQGGRGLWAQAGLVSARAISYETSPGALSRFASVAAVLDKRNLKSHRLSSERGRRNGHETSGAG
jgi:hypothetical protein